MRYLKIFVIIIFILGVGYSFSNGNPKLEPRLIRSYKFFYLGMDQSEVYTLTGKSPEPAYGPLADKGITYVALMPLDMTPIMGVSAENSVELFFKEAKLVEIGIVYRGGELNNLFKLFKEKFGQPTKTYGKNPGYYAYIWEGTTTKVTFKKSKIDNSIFALGIENLNGKSNQ